MAATGQGTIVAFTTAGAVTCARSITLPEWSLETIDVSCLSDTGFMKKLAADLVDGGEVQVELLMGLEDDIIAPSTSADTITVTLPTAGASSSILTGTGYITGASLPSIEIGNVLSQSVTFTFDGQTGPAWTPGTAV